VEDGGTGLGLDMKEIRMMEVTLLEIALKVGVAVMLATALLVCAPVMPTPPQAAEIIH
jgi:hypothetical protein